ncbi:MAG: YtxH domain-containing protein [Elusimicrobiales bacterium]|jgi:gas vesicle protein|nr:YtxH domain-containing protein [Elusimicrobiales bacterium]
MADRSGEVVTSFLLGAVLGAVAGVLLAPSSGKVTREKINDWLDETAENAKEKLENLEDEIKKRKEQLLKS